MYACVSVLFFYVTYAGDESNFLFRINKVYLTVDAFPILCHPCFSCSHLIIEHGTKRKSMPSPAHAPAKKKQASMLCSPSEEAGFSLGGPATDKDGT